MGFNLALGGVGTFFSSLLLLTNDLASFPKWKCSFRFPIHGSVSAQFDFSSSSSSIAIGY